MKQTWIWLLMSLCAVAFVACGSDDDDDNKSNGGDTPVGKVTLAEAVGTWQLTVEIQWKVKDGGDPYDYREDTSPDPDRIVIKADGTFVYLEYKDGEYREAESGHLDIENGYVVGNGMTKFTSLTIQGNVMAVAYTDYNHDGKGYDKYHVSSFVKVVR